MASQGSEMPQGSPMIMPSALIKPRSQSAFAPYSLPASSSSAVKTRASRSLSAVSNHCRAANSMAATAPFISLVPRP